MSDDRTNDPTSAGSPARRTAAPSAPPSDGAAAARDPDGPDDGRLVKIGALADRLGLTTRALRYWEERSLLPPARRTQGGMRVYGDEHVRAARGVLRLKLAGFSLDEIVDIQRALKHSTSALGGMADLARSLSMREEAIRERIREEQTLLAELEAARRCVGLCDGCEGKLYDADCITCLNDASGHAIPDCLSSLLEAATSRSPADQAHLSEERS